MPETPDFKHRYERITQRLAHGAASAEDESSLALAAVLERRIIESFIDECALHVTSDLLSERTSQAVAALSEHSVTLRIADGAVVVERCFCEADACGHPVPLLGRLLGVGIESIITNEGQRALRIVGATDAAKVY